MKIPNDFNLVWRKSNVKLRRDGVSYKNKKDLDFEIREDWSKVIHLTENKFFITGGSW